jgi:hypothetical protein
MAKNQKKTLIPAERIEQSVLLVRGQKVLLDSELAMLYGVEIRALNQAVQRNLERFPDDFMFRLTQDEWAALRYQFGALDAGKQLDRSPLRSQFVILQSGRGRHRKYPPYAFTEQGVAMLSSVLRSPRAVAVNIEIMRAFVRLRQVLAVNAELGRRLDEVEKHLGQHDRQFVEVIRVIRQLMESPPSSSRRRIGFDVPRERSSADKSLSGKGKRNRRQTETNISR